MCFSSFGENWNPWLLKREGALLCCLSNYIFRMDETFPVLTRNQASKNATVGKLDPPYELPDLSTHTEKQDTIFFS
jgi:hypothetical protein